MLVGNFSEFNASRDYMELMGDWYLEHLSEQKLRELVEKAGAAPEKVQVRWAPEGGESVCAHSSLKNAKLCFP